MTVRFITLPAAVAAADVSQPCDDGILCCASRLFNVQKRNRPFGGCIVKLHEHEHELLGPYDEWIGNRLT